jgi:hypothetical protein
MKHPKHPKLTPVESTALQGYHYDAATSTMTVKFHSGHTYHAKVSPEVHRAFLDAESKGGFWHKKLKKLEWEEL